MEKTMKHAPVFVCKRLRLLEELNHHGYFPYATVPEVESGGRYKNWLFLNSPEMEEVIEAYFEKARNRK